MSLKDNLSALIEIVKANFSKDQSLSPVFIGIIDNKFSSMLMPCSSQEEKETFSLFIQDLIAKNRLAEFVMISEAWTLAVDDILEVRDWLKTHGSLQNHTRRQEIVSILYCSAKEEIHYTADINRGIIPPVLENWNQSERKTQLKIDEFSSRFQNLFLKGKAGAN